MYEYKVDLRVLLNSVHDLRVFESLFLIFSIFDDILYFLPSIINYSSNNNELLVLILLVITLVKLTKYCNFVIYFFNLPLKVREREAYMGYKSTAQPN